MAHFGPVMVQVDEKNTWSAEQTFSSDTFIANGYGLIVGHTAQIALNLTPEFQIVGGATADSASLLANFVNNTDGPAYYFLKSRSNTIGSNTIVQNGDNLGHIVWHAADGSDFVSSAARITAQVDGTPGTNDMPGRILFLTTADGGSSETERMRIDSVGRVLIGDTANANMTIGLTIKQTTGLTNQVMCFKHADINVPMTLYLESDDFGKIQPTGTNGGLQIVGASTAGRTENVVLIQAYCGGTAGGTTKSTATLGFANIESYVSSGTTVTDPGTGQNVLTIRSGSLTQFIFSSDAGAYEDVGTAWTNFDAYDDPALLQDLRVALSNHDDPVKRQFHEFVNYNRESMERAKLVTFNDDGHNFVNMSRLAMLHTSAIVQLNKKVEELKSNLALLAKPDVSTLTEGRN